MLFELACETDRFPRELLAGRSISLSEIRASLARERMQSVWVHGMRRVGKSVLLQAALNEVQRERQGRIVRVRAFAESAPSFSGLCVEMARACSRVGIPITESSPSSVLRSVAAASQRLPIIVYLEGFDHAAGQLDVNDQAALRVVAQENANVAFVIETRRPPSFLLEDVDENSRLAGICTHIPVHPLGRADVEDFCRRSAEYFSIPALGRLGSDLWRTFGGFPFLIANGLARVAVRLQQVGESLEEALDEAVLRLAEDIRQTWLQLPQDIQCALRGEQQELSTRALKANGLHDRTQQREFLRPLAFLEVGKELGQGEGARHRADATLLEKASFIQELVAEANHAIKARSGRDGFRATHESAYSWSLTRNPCTEHVFESCVGYLYKLLWERTRNGDGGASASLLPNFLMDALRNAKAPTWVNVLRNDLMHDKSKPTDSEKRNRALEEVGDVRYALAGSRSLDTDEARALARIKLVDGVIEFLVHLGERARSAPVDGRGLYVLEGSESSC